MNRTEGTKLSSSGSRPVELIDDTPPCRVLIVDDNESSLFVMREVLEPLGQPIFDARTGEDALKLLLTRDFAVVLMDVKLPGIDGYETASIMRTSRRTRRIPIIFLTGVFQDPAQVLRGYSEGAVDYMLKPYDPDILRSKVSVFVELHRMREQEARRVAAEREHARVVEKENERRLFQAVLTQMPAGVVVVKAPSGEALLANERLAEILGRPIAEQPTNADVEFAALHLDGRPYTPEELPISRTLRTGEIVEGEVVLYARDQSMARLSLGASPIFDDADKVIAVVGTMVDITQRHAVEEDRERLIRALEQSNSALDQFAYVASHDLKAPLRGIANLSSWIEEDLGPASSGDTQKNLALLRGRVHRLEALIDGVLNYARAGKGSEALEEVSMADLVRETVDLLSPGESVAIELGPDLPTFKTERVPLQQVLLNLLGNAFKHASAEDPHVTVRVEREAGYYHFAVQDNGPGIAEEHQGRIWGLFQTLDAHENSESTGIGLAVVKKIVEARRGRVWVESAAGAGATFHVLWPG